MRSKILDAGTFGSRFHDVPDCFRRDSIAPNFTESTDTPEDRAGVDASRGGPLINGSFRPRRDWNGADMLSFPHQVGDHPVLLTHLKIFHSESHQFSTSQSAPDEKRENRSVTLSAEAV